MLQKNGGIVIIELAVTFVRFSPLYLPLFVHLYYVEYFYIDIDLGFDRVVYSV